MFRPGVEGYNAKRHGQAPIFPVKIMLVNQHPVARDNHRMRIGLLPTVEARADAADQRRIETFLLRRSNRPTVV